MPGRFYTGCCALVLMGLSLQTQAAAPRTFSEAKKVARTLYAAQSTEFYCGCKYRGNRIDMASCGYVPRKDPQRARRVEWEHIVSAWQIGHQRQCWQNGGRANCSRNDKRFRLAEADLHNLVPAIGEVNADRSNFSFAWLPARQGQYGACQTQVDFKARKVMPRTQVRGMVARTHLYMSKRYQLRLSRQDRQLFQAWNKTYPVQEWERQRNQLIACVTGRGNEFVGPVNLNACRTSR